MRATLRNRRTALAAAVLATGIAAVGVAGTGIATAGGQGKPAAPAAGTSDLGTYVQVIGPTTSIPAGSFQSSIVNCPAGTVALGGGEGNSGVNVVLTDSHPLGNVSWQVFVRNNEAIGETFSAFVVCGR